MQRSNGAPSACASCKHQRKKCTSKCALAPFFPVEKTREFQAVHKVFGVSNATKMVTSLSEEQRKVAVDSLVWEALCRQKDPVLGPYGDYRRICEELRLYKSQCHQVPITQESIVYKAQGIMGWSNKVNNNGGNFHGDSVVEYCPYGYSSHHMQDAAEKLRGDVLENGSSALILPQQHLGNGFNQQFIIAGQYNPLGSKSIESTLWEGSS